jgi:hypothetical protein
VCHRHLSVCAQPSAWPLLLDLLGSVPARPLVCLSASLAGAAPAQPMPATPDLSAPQCRLAINHRPYHFLFLHMYWPPAFILFARMAVVTIIINGRGPLVTCCFPLSFVLLTGRPHLSSHSFRSDPSQTRDRALARLLCVFPAHNAWPPRSPLAFP